MPGCPECYQGPCGCGCGESVAPRQAGHRGTHKQSYLNSNHSHRAANRRRRSAAKAAGLCRCGRERPSPGQAKCRTCNDEQNARRAEKRAQGLCADCTAQAVPGYSQCQKHRDKVTAKRNKRVAAGLCEDCNEPAAEGKTRCTKHVAEAARRTGIMRQRRKAAGLCYKCGKVPATVSILCQPCHRKERDRLNAARRTPEGRRKRHRDKHARRGLTLAYDGVTYDLLVKERGPACMECGLPEADRPSLGHKVPLSWSGVTTRDNTQVECLACNVKKNATYSPGVPRLAAQAESIHGQ